MTTLGRVSSAVVVLAVTALILIASIRPDLMHVGGIHVVDWIGIMIYVAAPVAWISALLHWARHSPRAGPKTWWRLVVVLGFVPGAIAYWFWGAKRFAGVKPARESDRSTELT
jgi:hypothetical protein